MKTCDGLKNHEHINFVVQVNYMRIFLYLAHQEKY